MFTVIIAEKNIIDVYKDLHVFLSPICSKEVAFCEWNREGESLEEMVPELYDVISFQNEWKAIVVNQDGITKRNPFDYVEYKEMKNKSSNVNWEQIKVCRNARFDCYDRAINNPLTKLASALCGVQTLASVVSEGTDYENLISGNMELYEYMLKQFLINEDCSYLAAYIRMYRTSELKRFVHETNIELLLEYLETANSRKIIDLIGVNAVQDFLWVVSNGDPFYCDPEYVESIIDNTKKRLVLKQIEKKYSFHAKQPKEIVCIAPRTLEKYAFVSSIKQTSHDETDYSRFTDYNLYPEKLKYIVFDMLAEKQKQYKAELLRLLCFMLLLAGNKEPNGRIREKRVYRAEVEFEPNAIRRTCAKYIGKLKATLSHIALLQHDLRMEREEVLDDESARELFEASVEIPVKIKDELHKSDLFAEYKGIGLSRNCPVEEAVYWDSQYHDIRKIFVRYLREPRRAIKTAVKDFFQQENKIDNEKALLLDEFQKEDIEYRLLEEEQNMVETVTTHLFDTAKYNEKIEKADKELRTGIEQRMTKKKTVLVAVIVVLAYLFGCLPLLIGNFSMSSPDPFFTALAMIGGGVTVLLIIGLIYLFVLRRNLVKKFKHFNDVMNGICKDIETGLKGFSKYLGHACNVMREFSVLEYTRENENRKENILKKHQLDVESKIKEISEAFSDYIVVGKINGELFEPYEYDFHLLKDYSYDMPSSERKVDIEYLQQGNYINVPVDYIKKVMLIREEIYD